MVIIVVAFPETDEPDEPTVTTAVLRTMRLAADDVTERIDGKGRTVIPDRDSHPGHDRQEAGENSIQEAVIIEISKERDRDERQQGEAREQGHGAPADGLRGRVGH